MNDSAHYARTPDPAPSPADTASVRAEGSSSTGRKIGKPPIDEPTIITGTPPIPAPAVSDSASRILEGRVMPGDRIGHFDLVEYVGGGGMGRVFRAIDTQLGRTVALKILPPEQAAGADAAQRFQNEAQSSARLDHENIARVYFVGEDKGLPFIVFEFVEGVNVRLLVEQKGPLPLADALSYTIQVAEALEHADSRGVVHRDIKPSNVLITPEGRVKLIDMGLARLRNGDPGAADLTQSGVTLGTFDYISPEQARDPRYADIRSDIYSLGCTVFFMLAGHPPFPEGTVLQKLLQHQGDLAPDIRQFRPDLPEEVSRVLRKMMAKDPRHRHVTSAELATDLLALAAQIGLRPMIPTSRVWLTPPDESMSFLRRHTPWMAPVAALICVVLLVDRLSIPRDNVVPPLIDADVRQTAESGKAEKSIADKIVASKDSWRKGAAKIDTAKKDLADERVPRKEVAVPPSTRKSTLPPFLPIDDADAKSPFSRDPLSEFPMSPLNAGQPEVAAIDSNRKPAAEVKPAPVDPPKRPGLLIVGESAAGGNEYSTLAAACNAAHDGDVIELRFNGPRKEEPMKLSNQQVTVQAGEGFRPVIVFRPTEINPIISRSMFTLSAGRLTMSDVAVDLYVPREIPADNWAIFETWGGQTVRLDRCSLTVRNASDQLATYHQEVAFVRAKPAPDADVAVDSSPAATPLATIELNDCVARGEAVFLCVEDLQPVYLLWQNGLLTTTEQLLAAGGGQTAPKLDELRLELRHVTAAVRGGLCRLSATPANPHQLTVRFDCTDNIILAARGAPLVEQEGTESLDKSRQQFLWKGDRNFYQDVDVFWMVRNMDSRVVPEAMNFDDWKAHWGASREIQPSRTPLLWRRSPNADRPVYTHTASDYSLEDPTFNDASGGAPGYRADRLPPLPSGSLLERSASETSVRGNAMSVGRDDG